MFVKVVSSMLSVVKLSNCPKMDL